MAARAIVTPPRGTTSARRFPASLLPAASRFRYRLRMGFFGKIFTWWNGAPIGTLLWSRNNGEHVGTDAMGNRYYRTKKPAKHGLYAGRERRWVIPLGANDASRVPAEWHGWLHGNVDGVPESHLPPPRVWETNFVPNETGTAAAYLPQGALQRGGKRARATGDYEAWSPDGDLGAVLPNNGRQAAARDT